MQVLIISGGSIDPAFATQYITERRWDAVICADGGMEFCRRAQILPELILGDFDSADAGTLQYYMQRIPERILRFPAEKDETDTELTIMKAIELGADEITILGGTGSRIDHMLGNIQLLYFALKEGVSCCLVDPCNRIRMIDGPMECKRREQFGKYISLMPFTPEVQGLCLKGFAYEVEDFTLKCGKSRGLSNEIAADTASISFTSGCLLVIESKD